MFDVGIEDINIYGSQLAIDSAEVAKERGISEKSLKEVGFLRRSVVPLFEDPVTLAVNASYPLMKNQDKDSIGLLIVATESGLDYGKPLSSYVHRYLELGPHCRNFEIKHACYGGTAALQMALNWLRVEGKQGRKALVVSSDVARPHVGHLSELTAGTGAIALLLSTEPKACTVQTISGYACREVYDVARPTLTFEYGDPVLSLYSYLDLLELAWEDYAKKLGLSLKSINERFNFLLYHTPLISLVQQAHSTLIKNLSDEISSEEMKTSFAEMVLPALKFNLELGNIYSGSLYVALAGLLKHFNENELTHQNIGLFSYGSGACAEFFSAVAPGNFNQERLHGIENHLNERKSLSVEEYEQLIYQYENQLSLNEFKPEIHSAYFDHHYKGKHLLILNEVQHYYRKYEWS